MEREKIKEYTLKISQSNRSGLVALMYDMADTYLEDAKKALTDNNEDGFKENVRNVDRVVKELQDILDFKYEISGNLYSLYSFCRRALAKSLTLHTAEGIEEAAKVLSGLGDSFRKIAKEDNSEPLMQNTQQVYAGMTYGKKDLTENYTDRLEASRGFFA